MFLEDGGDGIGQKMQELCFRSPISPVMTTLTVDAHREQMMRWLEAGRGYEFLTMADPYLDVCPDDHYVRLMAIREYLKLGLVVPAQELLEVTVLPAEFASIRESVDRLESRSHSLGQSHNLGRTHTQAGGAPVPWSQHAKRFEANLAAAIASDERKSSAAGRSGGYKQAAPLWSQYGRVACPSRRRRHDFPRYSSHGGAALSHATRRQPSAVSCPPETMIREVWAKKHAEYQLFHDSKGVDQVRVRVAPGRWRWIPRLGDHRVIDYARPMPDDVDADMPGPYLFDGLDLGWYFQRVYEATRDTFLGYGCALFVVEPDPALLAIVLHLHDWREILSDARIFWFIGESCTDRLRRVWDENLDLPFPRQGFTRVGWAPPTNTNPIARSSPTAVEVVQEAAQARQQAVRESLQDIEARYASRDVRYWARRFEEALTDSKVDPTETEPKVGPTTPGRGKPLRILAAVSTHTTFLKYSMRDARRALEALGHKCIVLTEKTPYDIIGPLTYHNAIREFDPDLFFIIDHLRPEFSEILPANLPVLTWDQDQLPHVFTKHNMQGIGKLDFVVGWSKAKCWAAGCNPKQFLHARIPTSPEQFSGEPLTDEERARYTCDVSYVSHASQTPQAFHDQERALYKEQKLQELLDVMYELTPSVLARYRVIGGAAAGLILEEASRRCAIVIQNDELRSRLTGWYLWRLGDRLFRHEALEWVADWARRTGRTFRIYGNGWDRHPTLAEFAAGPAENGRELLCVYRASSINLQLMPAGFIHQRAVDGLASGGFFLSRRTANDLRGTTLRKLDTRIRELAITSTRELLDNTDEAVQALLRDYIGEWLHRVDRNSNELLNSIRIAAELLHPDEVFRNFGQILFDSAAEFARKADRFLANEPSRHALTDEMRQVVIDHFSYRPTMDRFLRAMAAYLREACD